MIRTRSILCLAIACAGCDDELPIMVDYACNDSGVAEGNASVSGYAPMDAFFSSVIGLARMSGSLSRAIADDLTAIQDTFQIGDEQVLQAGSLAAALAAELDQSLSGDLKMAASSARCSVATQDVLMAELECEALAGCDVDNELGSLRATCAGTCSNRQSEMPQCEPGAVQSCTRFGSNLRCAGLCVGVCVEAGASLSMLTPACEGRCNGECTSASDEGACTKDATVSCVDQDAGEVTCAGTCDGEVRSLAAADAQCPVTPICRASSSADATLHGLCTFPLVELSYDLDPTLDAETRTKVEVSLERLRFMLPQILTTLRQAEGVLRSASMVAAVAQGSARAVIGEVTPHINTHEVSYRLGHCAPRELSASAEILASQSSALKEQVRAAQAILRVLHND